MDFQMNPVANEKGRTKSMESINRSSSGVKSRGSRIQEAGHHFSDESAIFILEEKGNSGNDYDKTTVAFFATCIIITTTSPGVCCSMPTTETTTIPKFRIKDVVINQRPLCGGSLTLDSCFGWCCCSGCKCGMCAKQQKTILFKLRASADASKWNPGSNSVEVKVMDDIQQELIIHYVYGPLLNSGDKTHALGHMIDNNLSKPAVVTMDMDRL
jgi:hypothetical protein